MAGARSMAIGAVDSHPCACFYVDALPMSTLNFRASNAEMGQRRRRKPARSLELSSSFVGTWQGWRPLVARSGKQQSRKSRGFLVVAELGGTYEEGYDDIHRVKEGLYLETLYRNTQIPEIQ